MSGELLTIASLNTRGIPLTGSQLAERYAVIGAGFDAGDADVVCCQELLTYWHLRLLVRRMRSFRQVNYRPAPTGPAGGLVTFSRRPVSGTAYRRFGRPPRTPGVPRTSRFQARLKGALVTRLARPGLCVINTHPVANHDGDWSKANRYYPLHRAQFAVLAHVVDEAGPRAVVCGDFNIARESSLFGAFMAATGLADAFEGACPPTLFMTRQPTERAAAPGVSAETGEGQARALLDGHRREDKPAWWRYLAGPSPAGRWPAQAGDRSA